MNEQFKYTTAIFIEKAKAKHGDRYDYSLVDYQGSSVKVKIICKEHGVFEQRPTCHIQGKNCHLCWKETLKKGIGRGRKPIKGQDKHKCPHCKQIFPRTSKYFGKNTHISDGLSCYCKSCSTEIQTSWKGKNGNYRPPSKTKDGYHNRYLKHKEEGRRRKYKITRYIKEGKLPIDFIDPNPESNNFKIIPKYGLK